MENAIHIKGNVATILGNYDHSFLKKLDLDLSFRAVGYEYSLAFKNGRWDGRTRLLSHDLKFNVGLLPKVEKYFIDNNINYTLYNHNRYIPRNPIDISNRLSEINLVPREHQINALNAVLEKKRGIVKVATGGGKTLIAALIVAAVGNKSIVYVIGKELLYQFHGLFESIFQKKIGIIGDGICDIQDITIASIWSVGKAFGVNIKAAVDDDDDGGKEKKISEKYFEPIRQHVVNAHVSILDECHLGAAETVQIIGRYITSEYTVGMSATVYRDDNKNLLIESIFGPIITNISASYLIESGFLVKPIIRFAVIPKMYALPKYYREIYKTYIVDNETRNDIIIEAAKSLVNQGFVTMILFKELEHGNKLYDKIKEDVNCFMLNGKMDSKHRNFVRSEVIDGKCKLILCSSIFDIGVDIPSLSGLILAGGGKSSIRALQRIGRVIRAYPGKRFAAIIDFYDEAKYLKDHSKTRKSIYERETGFEVQWIKKVKK